jgi:hypothetical protein
VIPNRDGMVWWERLEWRKDKEEKKKKRKKK